LEQGKQYGEKLHVRFVYATNGQQIYELDLHTGKGNFITKYPSPEELYERSI
jgi:type I restriction enzyme R subunit